ncbi:hypothetical protein GW17_00054414 [Ensete ventricosum]|nr:hypothetical protein GW17_00054414 [Ensete ventricosum]
MHPLKFPNSCIRAKVFMRKIGFKLRVMRLNRVESFYTFLLHFHSEGNEEEGRPAMVSPHARPAIHGQAATKDPARGRSVAARASLQGRPAPLAGAAAARWHTHLQRGTCKGVDCRAPARGCRPQGWPPLGRVVASGQGQSSPGQGQQRRRHRWGKRG